MVFNWLNRRRRAKLLMQPFPQSWESIIETNVFHDQQLDDAQRVRLRQLVSIFVAEKRWEGCHGLTITDEIKVTIAAQACLLVIGLQDVYFDHVLSILVYPTAYVGAETEITRAGVVIEGGQARMGEAWYRGPVVLSWADALAGGKHEQPGHNLVLHEFAHQLDMLNGRCVDGTPPLQNAAQYARWGEVLEPEYERLVDDCRQGRKGFIDCYGATNVGEFFAVLTESFFERPVSLRQHHPATYQVLQDFYQLDPASWSLPHYRGK